MKQPVYKMLPSKKGGVDTYERLDKPCVYNPSRYGLKDYGQGEGVTISVIDSGLPSHSDIKSKLESVDFSKSSRNSSDCVGHATMVAGVIGANNANQVVGIAPKAGLYFPKVVNASGSCSYDALLAAVLWSIVKKVDIMLISLASDMDCPVLLDAIRKARLHGALVIAAAGDKEGKYPACYDEVISVGRVNKPHDGVQLKISDRNMRTTYLHNKYAKASGTSLTAAVGAGLAALLIEKRRKSGRSTSPNIIYKDMLQLNGGS